VRGERIGGKVRQITVLNLGRHFPVKQDDWPLLCLRLEQLLHPQDNFLPIAVQRNFDTHGSLRIHELPRVEAPLPGNSKAWRLW
jgi:hypothetical protein